MKTKKKTGEKIQVDMEEQIAPKVSIIMPVYNASEYILEAIESVQRQTFRNWELIIVDEPTTTDATGQIVRQVAISDSRIRYVVNKEKLGISKSLNAALDIARGEYIARMDADDICLPNRIEEQVLYMEANPDIGICGCDYEVRGESWTSNLITDEDDIKSDLLFFVPLRHPTIIMRSSLLKKYGIKYNENILAAEDYDLFVRCQPYFRIANLEKKLLIYRRHKDAAVYRMIEESTKVNENLGRTMLKNLGVYVSDRELSILYRHCRLNCLKGQYEVNELPVLENLLIQIWEANIKLKIYKGNSLYKVLAKRWEKEIAVYKKKTLTDDLEFKYVLDNSVFNGINAERRHGVFSSCQLLTILETVQSRTNAVRTIKSILNQSYSSWKLVVIGSANSEIEKKTCLIGELIPQICYVSADEEERVKVLNRIIQTVECEYINVISDQDNLSANFYMEQIKELTLHPDLTACISSVKHSADLKNISKDLLKIYELFEDFIDHSGVVRRKKESRFLYSENISCYKYEMNSYIVNHCKYMIIPEELIEKSYMRIPERNEFFLADRFRKTLNISLNSRQLMKISGGREEFDQLSDVNDRTVYKKKLRKLFIHIIKNNRKYGYYNDTLLIQRLGEEWHSITGEEVAKDNTSALINYFKNGDELKLHNKIIIKLDRVLYNHSKYAHYDRMLERYLTNAPELKILSQVLDENTLKKWTWERYERTEKKLMQVCTDLERKIDQKVWDAEKRIIVLDDLEVEASYIANRLQYIPNEKIRVAIIFQVASFWPSIESLYEEMQSDERFEIKIVCYDESYDNTIKTETAQQFLVENNIPFIHWHVFSLKNFKPHIVIVQTPYDGNRRREYKSNYLKMAGYRVVYVPYGIEIGDTQHSRKQQLDHIVRKYAWKIFTFSETIHKDYRLYSEADDNVCVTGLPKFDSLYYKSKFPLNESVKLQAGGRKIILWKVHFPKMVMIDDELKLFTPYIQEYINFIDFIRTDKNNFYIFMPHPRFMEFNLDGQVQNELAELMDKVKKTNNIYVDDRDDYRNSLVNADAIIVDRSSVMVEAAAVGVPVLFMYNEDYREPMTKAIEPLIDSYYQGNKTEDMVKFIHMVNMGIDPKKNEREMQFLNCIPYFDGKCAKRIKEEIYSGIVEE